jgi:hypothetical protein
MMNRLHWLLGALLAVCPLLVFPIDPGVARGELVIDREAVPQTLAYALRQDNAEGLMDDPELRILLSDRELSTDLLAGPVLGELDQLARQGGVKGVLLRVAADGPPDSVSGTILRAPTDPQQSLPFFSRSGKGAGFGRFELGEKRVVGQVDEKPDEESAFPGVPVFGYHASFNAPIFEDRKVTATLAGKEARASAPAKAFLAFEKLLREGDLQKAEAAVLPSRWRETEQFIAQVGEAEFKAQVREMVPPTATREQQIERVVVRENRATIIYKEAGARGFTVLVNEGGTWKISG